ncbi:MAG: hypothetical protein QOH35_3782 [Acidobacteriaceae bacterium]|nr:hypothetical protein [Acidobacteriaceae bacterium]
MSVTPTLVAETALPWTYLPFGQHMKATFGDSSGYDSTSLVDARVQLKAVLRLNLDATGQPDLKGTDEKYPNDVRGRNQAPAYPSLVYPSK